MSTPTLLKLADVARLLDLPYDTLKYGAKTGRFPVLTVEATGRIFVRETDLELIQSMYAPK
jgi:hypothetical protein